jgi:hypothetical protein
VKRCVVMDQAEWDGLPAAVAVALHRRATDGPGRFGVVDGETGQPIADRFLDWLIGTMVLVFDDVEREREGREANDERRNH